MLLLSLLPLRLPVLLVALLPQLHKQTQWLAQAQEAALLVLM